jgi:serine protease Do
MTLSTSARPVLLLRSPPTPRAGKRGLSAEPRFPARDHGGAAELRVSALLVLALSFQTTISAAKPASDTPLDRLRAEEARTIAVIEKTSPAFVFLKGVRRERRALGVDSGSGFLISPDGYVLTNDHVVAGAEEVQAFLAGGKSYRAEVVGRDPMGDIALVRLAGAESLPFLELADSSRVRPGQRVLALGDPFLTGSDAIFPSGAPPSFEPAVSAGIVSAVHRYSDTYNDAIQFDVSVNRGNSGGPLLDMDGKVVGVNGKIEVRFFVGINTGVGYAVPAEQIQRFLGPLKAAGGGIVLHGTIHGLEVGERAGGGGGVRVLRVEPRTPAEKAGFQPGDHLTRLGGLTVPTRSRYFGILGTYPAGERIAAQVHRGGESLTLTATLVAPGRPHLGLVPQTAEGAVKGVRVASVVKSGPAARSGIRPGDVITRFDGEPLESTTDLRDLLSRKQPGEEVVVVLLREGERLELTLLIGGNPE